MIRLYVVLVLLLCAFAASVVDAKASQERPSEVRIQPSSFDEYRAYIEKEMRSGEALAEMSPEGRSEVNAILERMARMLEGVESVEQLQNEQRIALFNDQERLRVLLTDAETDSQLQCRREKVTGSNMPRSICQTVAQWRRYREDSQELLRRHQVSRLPLEGARGSTRDTGQR